MGKCFECGVVGATDKHHIKGRQTDPDLVVELCPLCHRRHHAGQLLYDNRASQEYRVWLDSQAKLGRYVTHQEKIDKLEELGYLPTWDHWLEEQPIDNRLLNHFRSTRPRALRNFLRREGHMHLLAE